MSANVNKGLRTSRQTDMESMIYTLIYLAKGNHPWEKLQKDDDTNYHLKLYESKICCKESKLCRGLTKQIIFLLNDIKKIPFKEVPNYFIYKIILKSLLEAEKPEYAEKFRFCWEYKIYKMLLESKKKINMKKLKI